MKALGQKKCKYCKSVLIRYGKRGRLQRYRCKNCGKVQQLHYRITRKEDIDEELLVKLHNEGLGISGIARILKIAKSTVQRKIEQLAWKLTPPEIEETNQEYEVDELRTYVGNKLRECWVMYAINRKTKQVVSLEVGRRTKANLKKVVDKILDLSPKKILTDGLNIYRSLLPRRRHRVSKKILSFIERKNLNLRIHLKRLNRKTICYSKSETMLRSSVRLYLFR